MGLGKSRDLMGAREFMVLVMPQSSAVRTNRLLHFMVDNNPL